MYERMCESCRFSRLAIDRLEAGGIMRAVIVSIKDEISQL